MMPTVAYVGSHIALANKSFFKFNNFIEAWMCGAWPAGLGVLAICRHIGFSAGVSTKHADAICPVLQPATAGLVHRLRREASCVVFAGETNACALAAKGCEACGAIAPLIN